MTKKRIFSELLLLLSPILLFFISAFALKDNEWLEAFSIYLRLVVPIILIVFSTIHYFYINPYKISVKLYSLHFGAMFTIFIFFSVIVYTAFNESILIDVKGRSSLGYFVNVNIINIAYFVWGILFAKYHGVDSSKIFFKVFLSLFLILLVNISLDTLNIDYQALSLKNESDQKSHLGYTDFYFLVAFFSFNSANGKIHKRIIVVMFFAGLFFLGGRSAMIFSLVPYLVIYHRKNYSLILLSALMFILASYLYRAQIFAIVTDDISILERLLFFQRFITFFKLNFFSHSINTAILIEGDLGKHVHNCFVYLEAYGIIGFSVVISFLVSLYIKLNKLNRGKDRQNLMFLFFYVILQFLLAKTIGWVHLWLLLGVLIGMYYKVEKEQREVIYKR